MSNQTIYIGVVTHRHGTNLYAGATEADVTLQLAEYCRDFWDEIPDPDVCVQDPPADDSDCITAYFKGFEEYGFTESYDIEAVELVAQAVPQ